MAEKNNYSLTHSFNLIEGLQQVLKDKGSDSELKRKMASCNFKAFKRYKRCIPS